jgi:predicted amidohydrolase YtcJ
MNLKRFDDIWVRRGPWKYLLDGAFSTRTAWLLEPYAGEPGNYGIADGVAELADRAVALSILKARQAAFHAIGGRTVRELINTIERYSRRYRSAAELRFRIEHAQRIAPGGGGPSVIRIGYARRGEL